MTEKIWQCQCCEKVAPKRFRKQRKYCKRCSKLITKVRRQTYLDLYVKLGGKYKFTLLKKKSKINNDIACRLIFEINKVKWAIDFSLDGKRLGTSTFVRKLKELEPFEEFVKSELD